MFRKSHANNSRRVAVCALVVCFLLGAGGGQLFAADRGGELSERRVRLLRGFVEDYLGEHGLESSTFRIMKGVLEDLAKIDPCPTLPSSAVIEDRHCRRAALDMTQTLVAENFPPLDIARVEGEAVEKFPIHEKGDAVTVWYRASPVRTMKVQGVYRGRTANSVQIGRHVILLDDMANEYKKNPEELLKFDREKSAALRDEYVTHKREQYDAAKEEFEKNVRDLSLKEQRKRATAANEESGYIFWDGKWRKVRDVVTALIGEVRERISREQQVAAEKQLVETETRIRYAVASQAVFEEFVAGILYQNPGDLLGPRAAPVSDVPVVQQDVAADGGQESSTPDVGDGDSSGVAGDSGEPADPPVVSPAEATEDQPIKRAHIDVPDSGVPWEILAAVAGVFVLAGGFGIYIWRNKPSAAPVARKFFEGRGKLQKSFWEMAEADPERFKYVAYRFPTRQTAREALTTLSYINESKGGDLTCLHQILFGFYPHKDKFVVFVGGKDLTYALWREASAVLPEMGQAEYFRVSTAPGVDVEVPNLEQLLADEALHVEHVEDRDGEGDDYTKYYVYKAQDKTSAMTFLQRAEIQTDGAHVVVQTPEGTWGKDVNGIYEES